MDLFIYPTLSEPVKTQLQLHTPNDVALVFRQDLPESEQQAAFQQADALLGNPPSDWFDNGPARLAFWQIDSAGFDKFSGVKTSAQVANMGDYFAWPCAETMIAGILGLYRRIPELAVLQSRSEWIGAPLREQMQVLRGKRVVVLGTGTIGMAVKQMLGGFDCSVRMLARTDPQADLHSADELITELPETDLVINCLPGTARGFVSAAVIAAMSPTCVYANVGRGSTTDEPALIDALQTGKLGGAVLDVTETEPLPTDSPLWTMPTVLLTQHTGGGLPNEDGGKVAQLLRNLNRFRAGQALENAVELGRGY
ncbi:D-2-hydroxyacid dehydrogenase [Spirosoma rhododendri]|uniref:D-2-hydroxyacid dehydrogenase n=1 Tax=Spirosoma rhododendri TaxID=2728024 RepID=A0A7L5DQG0_9BACT|nr:D-2-hydroxyacid dehydrogenase [Spirosoma rhododendri]QJD79711.1 D-2-hydroxyacid dehydrogenase [Spirosoma rhododendri]